MNGITARLGPFRLMPSIAPAGDLGFGLISNPFDNAIVLPGAIYVRYRVSARSSAARSAV